MSTSYYAKAIIGIEIDPSKLVEIRMVRNCSCAEAPGKTMKYCPNCSRKAWSEKEWPADEDFDYDNNLYCGLKVICLKSCTRDMDFYHIYRMFVVGAGAETDDLCYTGKPVMCSLPEDISEIKETLKNILEPKDLWDESKFGLWAIGTF